jgi:glycosyltransferase involved in cell wall biosynthesis
MNVSNTGAATSPRRRIAFITNLYPPIQTGTGFYVEQLAALMAERGHHVLVITCGDAPEPYEERRGLVNVLRLPSFKAPRTKLLLGFDSFRLGWSPRNVRRSMAALAEHRIEVIQVCGHLLDLTYLGAVVARRSGIPTACSIHTRIHHPTNAVLNFLLQTIDRTVHRSLTMRRFQYLFPLDKVMEEYVAEAYPTVPTIPVPWAVDCDFESEPELDRGGPLTVLSIGHLTEMRSRHELISAIGQLVAEGVPCRLRIVGKICTQSPIEQVKRARLEQHVEFVGELPRERTLEELRRCDVHAMWISNKGVGSAGMESMYAGIPTMMWSDRDQLSWVPLRHLEDCILIDPTRPDQIAEILKKLAADPELRRRIGRNGAVTANTHFYWPNLAPRMEQIYEQVIAGR